MLVLGFGLGFSYDKKRIGAFSSSCRCGNEKKRLTSGTYHWTRMSCPKHNDQYRHTKKACLLVETKGRRQEKKRETSNSRERQSSHEDCIPEDTKEQVVLQCRPHLSPLMHLTVLSCDGLRHADSEPSFGASCGTPSQPFDVTQPCALKKHLWRKPTRRSTGTLGRPPHVSPRAEPAQCVRWVARHVEQTNSRPDSWNCQIPDHGSVHDRAACASCWFGALLFLAIQPFGQQAIRPLGRSAMRPLGQSALGTSSPNGPHQFKGWSAVVTTKLNYVSCLSGGKSTTLHNTPAPQKRYTNVNRTPTVEEVKSAKRVRKCHT